MSEQVEDIMDFIEPEEYLKMNELPDARDMTDCRMCKGWQNVCFLDDYPDYIDEPEDCNYFEKEIDVMNEDKLREACDCNEGFGPSGDCGRCGGTGTVLTPEDKLRENFENQHSYQIGATWVVWNGGKYVKYCKHLNSLADDWAARLNNELAIFRAGAECQQAKIHELEEVITQNEEYIQGHIKGKAGQQAENKKLREEKTELKNAYAETFEEYLPAEKLGEANEFLLSRFEDYEMSKAIVDRKQALRNKE